METSDKKRVGQSTRGTLYLASSGHCNCNDDHEDLLQKYHGKEVVLEELIKTKEINPKLCYMCI